MRDEQNHARSDGGRAAHPNRLAGQTSLAEEVSGTEHPHHRFSSGLRQHRQFDAAGLNIHDILTRIPLREDALSATILPDGLRKSRRFEKRLRVERRYGFACSPGGLPWLHAASMAQRPTGGYVSYCTGAEPSPDGLSLTARQSWSLPSPCHTIPPKGTTVPIATRTGRLMASSVVSIIVAALMPIGASGQAPGIGARNHCRSGRSGHQAGADRLFRRVSCLHRHHRRARERELPGRPGSSASRAVRPIAFRSRGWSRFSKRRSGSVSSGCATEYRVLQNPDGSSTIVTDLPAVFVTITRAGRSKRIEDYFGAPDGLKQLERQIDEAAGTRRWILLDAPTLEQLVRDGWQPAPEERAELFRRAVEDDEPAVVKGLIDLGADPNGSYFGTNTPPLMMVRSAAVTRVLLAAGANPNAINDNGGTPLGWSVYLAPDVGQLLLNAGAHVDGPSDRDGRTPLWRAACAGNHGSGRSASRRWCGSGRQRFRKVCARMQP